MEPFDPAAYQAALDAAAAAAAAAELARVNALEALIVANAATFQDIDQRVVNAASQGEHKIDISNIDPALHEAIRHRYRSIKCWVVAETNNGVISYYIGTPTVLI